MAAVEMQGLESLRRRLAALGAMAGIEPALRAQAEALAAGAKATLEERAGLKGLSTSVEIIDESQATKPRYAVGSADPVGRHLEFGTVRTRAFPWLNAAFLTRLPAVNHALRKVLVAALQALGKA